MLFNLTHKKDLDIVKYFHFFIFKMKHSYQCNLISKNTVIMEREKYHPPPPLLKLIMLLTKSPILIISVFKHFLYWNIYIYLTLSIYVQFPTSHDNMFLELPIFQAANPEIFTLTLHCRFMLKIHCVWMFMSLDNIGFVISCWIFCVQRQVYS